MEWLRKLGKAGEEKVGKQVRLSGDKLYTKMPKTSGKVHILDMEEHHLPLYGVVTVMDKIP